MRVCVCACTHSVVSLCDPIEHFFFGNIELSSGLPVLCSEICKRLSLSDRHSGATQGSWLLNLVSTETATEVGGGIPEAV